MSIFAIRVRGRRAAPAAASVDPDQIRAGTTFARENGQNVVETARVLCIDAPDGGVPHVRYNCRLQRASTIFEDGPRTLALPVFLERYHIASAAPRAGGCPNAAAERPATWRSSARIR